MIYIVRHGETNYNKEKRMQGQTDIELNETGRSLAKDIAEQFKDIKIDEIVASDLRRASETAEIVNQYHELPIRLDKRLREFNYGTIEGRLRDEITPETWTRYNKDPHSFEAETMEDIFKRVSDFWNELSLNCKNKNILVVSHGGPIKISKYYFDHGDKFDYDTFLRDYMHGMKIRNLEVLKIANRDLISKGEKDR